jgi:hypothetical protein
MIKCTTLLQLSTKAPIPYFYITCEDSKGQKVAAFMFCLVKEKYRLFFSPFTENRQGTSYGVMHGSFILQ